jgi:hypothetical protein
VVSIFTRAPCFSVSLSIEDTPLLEKNIKTDSELFLKAIEPYCEDVVVAVQQGEFLPTRTEELWLE